jgi:alpha-glucosidase (family GH31 glycosyl hydrolase)
MKKKLFLIILGVAINLTSKSNNIPFIYIEIINEFPVIHIKNTNNPEIIIQPVSSKTGSIGYVQNGIMNWLKGKPILKNTGDKTIYIWGTGGNEINMEIDEDKQDLNFHFLSKVNNYAPTKWFINFKSTEDEKFCGVMERVVDGPQTNSWNPGLVNAINLRGEIVEVKLKPTVSAYAPFFISSCNFGVYVDGTWPGLIDFCKTDNQTVQMQFEGSELRFKLYRAKTVLEIVQAHALETGPSFVPPKWAFGPWRWRDEHVNRGQYYDGTPVLAPYNSEITEDILMMEAYGIPCTGYWIDRPWSPGSLGFDDYMFDNSRIPQPENMIKWLNSKGIELAMWIGPFVMGDMAKYAYKNNFYLRADRDNDINMPLIDFTNNEACKWWGENGVKKLAQMGVKGFKLDRADGETLSDSSQYKTSIGTSYRENYNDYARQYAKATYDAVKPILGDDFILFPRAQYSGSSKYGAMWAGDIAGGEYGLRAAIIGMQRCAIMGYPNWGSDIGGYWGNFDRETCIRWIAFGCFSPMMEVGPTQNKGFWDLPDTPKYDSELIATWRLYAITRMKLVDYIQRLSIEANKTGIPIIRPLFLMYPDQKLAWDNWQTFLVGPDILVSVIWENKPNKHQIYLPANEFWVDAWDTTKVYEGGKYIEVEVPIYKIPVFIRKNSHLKLGDLNAIYRESLEIAKNKPDLTEIEKKESWK